MEILSQKDLKLEKYREKIEEYVKTYESMGFVYWVFITESVPIAIFFSGKEPVNLISPPGTPMGMIKILEYNLSKENINEIARKSKKIGKENNANYIVILNVPKKFSEIVDTLKTLNFEEHASWYKMKKLLDKFPKSKGELKLKEVQKEEVRDFLNFSEHCTSGSYDDESMLYLAEISDKLLNFWYDMQILYYVCTAKEMIGILNLNLNNENNINNIGVAPEHRKKGYGREIMKYAFEKLREKKIENAGLRVHVRNVPAKHLYDSLGFKVVEQLIDIIYWNK
jgi:ribosomal protein S18 acetylase RimI-like enzyme